MCGIAGYFNSTGIEDPAFLKDMCDRLTLRGPDAQGFYCKDHIGLGHRRLSIIDLATGDQPMYSIDRKVVIVFNGEIYNFQELKNDLVILGYKFQTTSDTEVIINCYLAWGINETLQKLEGMFAFALYDLIKNELYIARDKFGEKPLYYYEDDSSIYFASELKAFGDQLKKFPIDVVGLNYFLTLTYIPAPYTIYSGVKKLEPSTLLTISSNGIKKITKYYNFELAIKQNSVTENFVDCKHELKQILTESIRKRMISDVPLGTFLSGGIDSSIVSTIMSQISNQPINTFSIGFKEKTYDESRRAQLIATHIKSNHTVHYLDYKDVVSMVDEIILYYDEPFGDSSALPSYYVAKLAREKVKVVLTGDCADELFGGYDKYLGSFYVNKYRRIPLKLQKLFERLVLKIPHHRTTNALLRKIKKIINNVSLSEFDLHYNLMSLAFNDEERFSLLQSSLYKEIKPEIKKFYDALGTSPLLEKSQFTDVRTVLEGDMLVKVDRICMMNSLEARVPFLDSKIAEFALRLPSDFKINGKNKKYILKETFKDILPKKTLGYSKKGFGVPVDYWFKNELRDELENLLRKERIEQQGIFDYRIIAKLMDEHMSGRENHKSKLWNLYVFQKWYDNKWN